MSRDVRTKVKMGLATLKILWQFYRGSWVDNCQKRKCVKDSPTHWDWTM
jgi:hypothetical protein